MYQAWVRVGTEWKVVAMGYSQYDVKYALDEWARAGNNYDESHVVRVEEVRR